MDKIENLVSVSKANWLNLLADLRNKSVLNIGTDNLDAIITISYSGVGSLYCVGEPREELNGIVSKYYSNIYDKIDKKFDAIIVDSKLPIGSGINSSMRTVLVTLVDLLAGDGALLLCSPAGKNNIKYRMLIKSTIRNLTKYSVSYFICDPSTEKPYTIIPYLKDVTWLTYNYPNIQEINYQKKLIIKNLVKKVFFKIFGLMNPLRGVAIVISNSNLEQKLPGGNNKEDINIKAKATSNLTVDVSMTNYYLMKHYLFTYNSENKKIKIIKKIGFNPPSYANDLEKEYKNMLLFDNLIDNFNAKNVEIPRPLEFYKHKERSVLSMTAIQGLSLKYIIEKNIYHGHIDEVIKLLNKATDVQIIFQKICNQKLADKLETVHEDYGHNYTKHNLKAPVAKTKCVQHGDFAANNILFDVDTGSYGIIDWEWLSAGFPPLLDIFSLFTSLRFTLAGKKYCNFYERYYDAIIDTYFNDNWFSRCLMANLIKYNQKFNLDNNDLYTYYIHFLIFHCNKYRIHKIFDHQKLYERMLDYSVKNEKNFISNINSMSREG